ncbi:hypothetical protein JTE90_017924 [Oedothorax gibbosus]|uniref:Matrin-type domain-containing protein n=1 Tax=Oedothorax gibbosus TaxID=931172 RepID=A0AAV6VI37_9ARAC|nr:hypothetical protein JTE90_017924 [Oedothorax gibbosus]
MLVTNSRNEIKHKHMEEHDKSKSGNDPTSNQEKLDQMITYLKRQKQDQAKKPLDTEDLRKTIADFFANLKKTKYDISRDEENKHRRTYPKHFKKSSHRFPEHFRGRRESPPTVRPRHESSKSRPCSSDSSINESPNRNSYPKGFDLRSILHRKSCPSQENTDRNLPNKSYKSLVHERSSSVEMDNGHQFLRRKPRSPRRSTNRSGCRSVEVDNADLLSRRKQRSQRRSSNHSSHRSCRCKSYDSFSSSENEYYHSTNHEKRLSRRHSRRSYRHKQSHSRYPDPKESIEHGYRSQRSATGIPIDLGHKPHSSRSQPPFQSDYLDHYNPVPPAHSHSYRSFDVNRDPYFSQNYAGEHTGYKRNRSSSFEQWGWSRSPSKDDDQEKYFEEDSASERRRHKTKKIKVSSSAKKQKFPVNEIQRSPTLDRGSSRRYSCKKDLPKKTLKGEPHKDKLKKEKCPVDKEYNKRLYEEFIKTTKKNIEKWITSNDESNSIERSPRALGSVATNNEPVWQTESQDIALQEIGDLIEKCKAKSQQFTSKEMESSVVQNPIVVSLNETDEFEEGEIPDITFVEEKGLDGNIQCRKSESPEVIFESKVLNEKNQCKVSEVTNEEDQFRKPETPEVIFESKVLNEKNQCKVSEVTNEDQFRKPETPEVIFDSEVLNEKNQCKVSEVTNEDQFRKPEAPKITSNGKEPLRNTVSLSEGPPAIQNECKEKKPTMPNSFFCNLCQLQLTSEVTFNTHIVGRKHKKKMQSVYKITKDSLQDLATPLVTLDDTPRFDKPPLGKKRKLTRRIALLQNTIDEIIDEPVAGLEFVHEIISPMDVGYYCSLCDAPCQAISIMPHLTGFRHQLRVARQLFPDYDLDGDQQDQGLRREVRRLLRKYEKKYGRATIQVFKEQDDPDMRPGYNQAGPSNRYPTLPFKKEPNDDRQEQPTRAVFPDLSKGDFFCRICDSHMNNLNMWEQHLRGRRHLQNVQKVPGESISKVRYEKLPGVVSKLEQLIDEQASEDLIVGLDYIRETRGPAGEMYNCFLCGACSTNYDIIQHLLLLKHRTKYLEQLNFEGKSDVIQEINSLELKEICRESLINYQCYKMVDDYGRGKVEVYKNKN